MKKLSSRDNSICVVYHMTCPNSLSNCHTTLLEQAPYQHALLSYLISNLCVSWTLLCNSFAPSILQQPVHTLHIGYTFLCYTNDTCIYTYYILARLHVRVHSLILAKQELVNESKAVVVWDGGVGEVLEHESQELDLPLSRQLSQVMKEVLDNTETTYDT